jgi:hypothetical protein
VQVAASGSVAATGLGGGTGQSGWGRRGPLAVSGHRGVGVAISEGTKGRWRHQGLMRQLPQWRGWRRAVRKL